MAKKKTRRYTPTAAELREVRPPSRTPRTTSPGLFGADAQRKTGGLKKRRKCASTSAPPVRGGFTVPRW